MSLRIIKGLPLQQYPDAKIGIMAHANTSQNFQEALQKYPCEDLNYCDAVSGPCQFPDNICACPFRDHILSHTIKMCDSGIFTKEGATLSYQQLFEAYEGMDVEYGIMIDVFLDPQATLESGREALKAYEPFKEKFKLVGVAHGQNVEEYLECYRSLKEMGFTHVAVGGMLRRIDETVRYAQVRDEDFMYQVLDTLREKYPDDWLFALGSFNPSRLEEFKKRNVWGDYKGWIFQYKKRDDTLNPLLNTFASNHLAHLDIEKVSDHIILLRRIVVFRDAMIKRQAKLSQTLHNGRREVRALLEALHQEVRCHVPNLAAGFKKLTTHGLLKPSEENLVYEALDRLNKKQSKEGKLLIQKIQANRNFKEEIDRIDERVDKTNSLLIRRINKFKAAASNNLTDEIQNACAAISGIIQKTEQEYRLEQVREVMSVEILSLLSNGKPG
ncbi:MAG: hypothetical protein KJ077_26085 [Anaerolineae bacterium]|nr:hypothetical protein [Anaerolineae bacterium]